MYLKELGKRDSGVRGKAAKSQDLETNYIASRLRFGSAQEEFDGISYSLGEFVRSGKIDGPLTDYGIEKSFHKFGQVYDRKIAGYLAVFLAFRDDFAEKADRGGFRSAQLR
jgi:hypothetical protein